MTSADSPRDDKLAALQRQIVELRLHISQMDERHAALIRHEASLAVQATIGGRALTEAERDWVRDACAAAAERKRVRSDLVLHFLKWGLGGAAGFALWSMWEAVKAKIGLKP